MQAGPKQKKLRPEENLASQSYDGGSSDEETSSKKTAVSRKNHCEVEKRRRDKMNKYLTELATMIPACSAVPRKLDKLTVLKMAVDHVKALRGDLHSGSDYKPSFLSDDELKQLIVEAANGFMLIVTCQQGRVLYVSETIEDVLQEMPNNWKGKCFYDLLHPKDIQRVRSQLESMNIDETLQANTAAGYSRSSVVAQPDVMSGLRRSFLCRVRMSQSSPSGEQLDLPDSKGDFTKSKDILELIHSQHMVPYKYSVLHCTGFIRKLTSEENEALMLGEGELSQCLVAMARLQPFGSNDGEGGPPQEPSDSEFVARVSLDGRFSYMDHRVSAVLGYLPQDLIGQMCYEYFHPDDIRKMVELFHEACQKSVPMPTINYRFLSRERKWVWLAMKAFSFRNPYTKQVEYIICTNVVMKSKESSQQRPQQSPEQLPNPQPMDFDRRDMTEKFVRSTIANQALLEVTSQQDNSMPQDQVINDIFTMITPATSQPQTQAGMFSCSISADLLPWVAMATCTRPPPPPSYPIRCTAVATAACQPPECTARPRAIGPGGLLWRGQCPLRSTLCPRHRHSKH
uniref:Aryl hydrocarbon receptor nuclear translocator n=1 Tax=Halisarca dujardinii TaxID=2583056 RepID=A0A6C0PP06_HALDU|nr:aryl hydrocarbon receptor nuclear translocator [Halisarca dujardinii]